MAPNDPCLLVFTLLYNCLHLIARLVCLINRIEQNDGTSWLKLGNKRPFWHFGVLLHSLSCGGLWWKLVAMGPGQTYREVLLVGNWSLGQLPCESLLKWVLQPSQAFRRLQPHEKPSAGTIQPKSEILFLPPDRGLNPGPTSERMES